ncbi:hypothetical protein BDR06DRAFT_1012927 [Suillus hirtellus]|nr:hypothetical protein BDR06DRAFT_1012927 [Suillus hirtellus]
MVSSGKLSSRVTHSSSRSQARKKIKLGLKSRGTHSNSNSKISSQGLRPSSKDVDVSTHSVEIWLDLQLVEIKHSVQSILCLTVPLIKVLSIPGQSVCTLRDLVNATLAAINLCALLKSVQPDLELVLSHGTTALRKGQGNFYMVNSTIDKQVHVIVPADKNLIALRVAGANEASPPEEQSEESCRYSTAVASTDHMTDLLARTPQLFTEKKIKSIDKYIRANPKAQIGGSKRTRGFHVGLQAFLKSTTAYIPLHDDVDSLDNDSLDDGSLRDNSLEDDDGSLKDDGLEDDGLEDDLEDDAFKQWDGIDDHARYGRT